MRQTLKMGKKREEALRAPLRTSLLEICNIPSPSYGETPLTHHILKKLQATPDLAFKLHRSDNSFIVIPECIPEVNSLSRPNSSTQHKKHLNPLHQKSTLHNLHQKASSQSLQSSNRAYKRPHIAIVGHLDVVPPHFLAQFKQGRIYGAGASDMQAGIAVMLGLLTESIPKHPSPYQLSFIFYACEEVAELRDNGLYRLIRRFPKYFKDIDLAIVAEPTDGMIQLGCVGSYHAEVIFKGQQAHSARPWDGANALSRASTFIRNMAKMKPKRRRLWGVDFFDVINITESHCEPGKTTLPAWWKANVNFRFAPYYSEREALARFKQLLQEAGVVREHFGSFKIWSRAPAGHVIETPLFKQVALALDRPKAAKQAWTDVAQLSALGIPAFNYGPGLTAQCHRTHEYVHLNDTVRYAQNLINALFTTSTP